VDLHINANLLLCGRLKNSFTIQSQDVDEADSLKNNSKKSVADVIILGDDVCRTHLPNLTLWNSGRAAQ